MVSNSGSQFEGDLKKILQKCKIKHHQSYPYHPQTDGAIEAATQTICNILKRVDKTREWIEKIPYALWGYRPSIHAPVGATPHALVHDMKPMLPIKVKIQLWRVIAKSELLEDPWYRERYDELAFLGEWMLTGSHHIQGHQKHTARAFRKRFMQRVFKSRKVVLHFMILGESLSFLVWTILGQAHYCCSCIQAYWFRRKWMFNFTSLDQFKKFYA